MQVRSQAISTVTKILIHQQQNLSMKIDQMLLYFLNQREIGSNQCKYRVNK
jgi:hypothetical protein